MEIAHYARSQYVFKFKNGDRIDFDALIKIRFSAVFMTITYLI